MKSAIVSSEKSSVDEIASASVSSRQLSENAKKVQKMLKRRRELLAAAQGKLRIEENGNEKKPQKTDVKDSINNQKSEPTSDEYDEDEEHPELTLTENSESYDSNDSLNGVVPTKNIMNKG